MKHLNFLVSIKPAAADYVPQQCATGHFIKLIP